MARIAAGPTGEVRREQIIDAAMAVFAERGYAEATNKDIARLAGVTPPLIYHYFRTKRDLFHAILCERSPIGNCTELLAADGVEGLPPRLLLTRFGVDLLARLESTHNSPTFQMMATESMRDDEVKTLFAELLQALEGAVAGYLRMQMAAGALRPLEPGLVARVFLGSLVHASMYSNKLCIPGAGGPTYTHEQIVDTLVDVTLDGLAMQVPVPG